MVILIFEKIKFVMVGRKCFLDSVFREGGKIKFFVLKNILNRSKFVRVFFLVMKIFFIFIKY